MVGWVDLVKRFRGGMGNFRSGNFGVRMNRGLALVNFSCAIFGTGD